MFKWIKQLFKMDNNYYAGLPFSKWQSESLPCAAMQSEVIANEIEEKEQSLSEPVNLIVESLKEEGRWTCQHCVDKYIGLGYKVKDTKTDMEFTVNLNPFPHMGCDWLNREEDKYLSKALAKFCDWQYEVAMNKALKEKQEEITSLYKKASNAK